MKKNYAKLALVALLATVGMTANAQFFERTSYVGAFGQTDWTKTWANYNPQNTTYGATSATLSGSITSNLTLDANKVYLISGFVYVESGVTLTIPAGTVLRGDLATKGTLIIERGAKIVAEGTASNPIVFTSNQAAGQRKPGDWGGVILLGKAPSNQPGDASKNLAPGEGIIEGGFTAPKGVYGGTNPADNSGTLKYVRIEFPGIAFQPNSEINGLTLGSIGSATTIDYIQISYSGDDSYEWFGGTVNCKHLISYIGTDDDFDTDNGYVGKVQFGVSLKHPDYYDATWNAPTGASTSEGFESDNNAAGDNRGPITMAVFSNMTLCGPIREDQTYADLSSTAQGAFRRGARIRRSSGLSVMNSIFMGFRAGLYYDAGTSASATAAPYATPYKALNSDTCQYRNNIIAGCKDTVEVNSANAPFSKSAVKAFITNATNANRIYMPNGKATGLLMAPHNYSAPDWRPVAGSIATTGSSFSGTKFAGDVFTVGITDDKNIIEVAKAYPNPTNGATTIEFSLTKNAAVSAGIYDITGKLVIDLGQNVQVTEGISKYEVNTSALTAGVYFSKISVNNQTLSVEKIIVVK